MIRIKYRAEGGQRWLKMEGHAIEERSGGGVQPSDLVGGQGNIVCAGASAILYALLGYLCNNEDVLGEVRTRDSSGDAEAYCRYGAEEAFEMAVIGLMQIAKQYPELVTVEGTL